MKKVLEGSDFSESCALSLLEKETGESHHRFHENPNGGIANEHHTETWQR